ncbi:MAG: hypothetical protein F6K63_30045 [Moorea sp. SIO1G6]|uniref:hypothetical protein n=1 Tax=Moorena sp. SIO1G6 TaxID=2607840 RepID=UPI0013C1B118|nr:hypothetical protein [Moorena sp. SIO1G6]NET68412.1 hypothetical protein [Moorena sp. SIO1G6]
MPLASCLFFVPVIRSSLFPAHSAITNNLGLLAFWPSYANGHATRTTNLKN